MLAFLEFRTLLFSSAMVAGIFAALMFGTMRSRKTYPGYGRWAWAEVAFAALNLFQAFRGQTSILFTLLAGNIAAACAMVLLAEGLRQFLGKPYRNYNVYAVSFAFVCGTLYFHLVHESLGIRTLLFCTYVAGMSIYAAIPLLRLPPLGNALRKLVYRGCTAARCLDGYPSFDLGPNADDNDFLADTKQRGFLSDRPDVRDRPQLCVSASHQ